MATWSKTPVQRPETDPHAQYLLRPDPVPSVTGSRDGNTALESLLTALAAAGLITDDTTP